ncbi:hypothetical protein HGH93_31085 [Chitinophaga polysaccharea]|uniref:hypothetical protein n=1 Tax=Chitinophaga polysaccharea TaxID=1293035 RepID=UPI001455B2D0|nr:hypothetical protein [Chitinophaga polysaccharea]NLR62578.1 hypothetical protein [Chitinophaga polysaccharea]
MKQLLLLLWMLLSFVVAVQAQHEHNMPAKDTSRPQHQMKGDSGHMPRMADMPMDIPMSHAFSLQLPMNRNGSGTGWLPDASPMYGYMLHSKKWMYMVHGNIFLRYTYQDIGHKGSRGDSRLDAPNWMMLMAQRKVGSKGLFHYNVMISLDRLTEGGAGYPLLFQSGESWKNKPLVDRQHPHDLFSELSVSYSYAFSKKVDAFIYFGYPGEPAIGSVAFMHRPSALSNPDAPISHHWNDGTHITFGVATLGIRLDKFKLEGSVFTGREPDENRYNFDRMKFDSWSGRLSYSPSENWALQVSHGYIKSPEMLHPEEDINRTTASAIFSAPLQHDNRINITALWGLNKAADHPGENAVLVEGAVRLKRTELYTRYEWVQKSTEELDLDLVKYGERTIFPVHALTTGISYDLLDIAKTRLAVGGQFGVFFNDRSLYDLYGKQPLAAEIYLRLYPGLMKMNQKHWRANTQ